MPMWACVLGSTCWQVWQWFMHKQTFWLKNRTRAEWALTRTLVLAFSSSPRTLPRTQAPVPAPRGSPSCATRAIFHPPVGHREVTPRWPILPLPCYSIHLYLLPVPPSPKQPSLEPTPFSRSKHSHQGNSPLWGLGALSRLPGIQR